MLIEIQLPSLADHPANRSFPTAGGRWEAFRDSIAARGVLQPLLVRPQGRDGYQVVAGHRRKRAALDAGLKSVPCLVKELTDREALELLVIENLEREDLDAVEEARGVRALLEDCGMAPGEVAARLHRSLEWVRTRQLVLELPEEAQAAMRLPRDDDRHLHVGTVQLMLDLRGEERETAVQMVLHPDFQLRTLSPKQAAEAIRQVILKPRKERETWEAQREALAKTWRAALRKNALPGTREEVLVQVLEWTAVAGNRASRAAEESVPLAETMPEAPVPLLWQHLATRHGMAIRIIPEGDGGSRAVVDEVILRQAEQALAEHGKEQPWIAVGRKKTVLRTAPDAVARATAALEGEGEATYNDEEPPETVIEQTIEQTGVIDLGAVRRLREWAAEGRAILSPIESDAIPLWVPRWARECLFKETVAVCDWVLGLKHKPTA